MPDPKLVSSSSNEVEEGETLAFEPNPGLESVPMVKNDVSVTRGEMGDVRFLYLVEVDREGV